MDFADETPDIVDVDVSCDGQVRVFADLHLCPQPTDRHASAILALARSIEASDGPGVVVFAGNLFDSGCEISEALRAYPEFCDSLASYAAGPGRRVLVLPGDRDTRLAASLADRQILHSRTGAETALAADLHIGRPDATRKVRVEPGQSFDPLSAATDPRNPLDSPYSAHIRGQVVPALRSRAQRGRRRRVPSRARPGWLDGVEQLDDAGSLARFVVSRLVYRRLIHASWLIVAAFVAALALRIPAAALYSARHGGITNRFGLFVLAIFVELLLLVGAAFAAIRATNRAMGALAIEDEPGSSARDPNLRARSAARTLVGEGYWGLVTGHTCRAELTHLGPGFYANAGAVAEVVSPYPSRLPGLGLPPPFLASAIASWVETAAGESDPVVRLMHASQDIPGSALLERLVADRFDRAAADDRTPKAVSCYPEGESWPPLRSGERRDRRVRRLAALLLMAVGFGSLISAMSDPAADRLSFIRTLFPLIVPQVAAAGAAFLGVGLIVVARSVRRGQRRAWVVCEVLLVTVAVLHLIKGIDVGEVSGALASAAILYLYRDSFRARSDVLAAGRGVATVSIAAVLVAIAGALAVEISTAIDHARNHRVVRVSWTRAFEAALARMVGSSAVTLPPRIETFLFPTMVTASVGLLVALLVVTFRPVVARRSGLISIRRDASTTAADAATTKGARGDRLSLRRHTAARRDLAGAPSAPDTGAAGRDGVALPGDAGLAWAREVVGRHGSGTLDYFALRSDKSFFFWGDTVVAHAVYGSVCLVSPDPVGPLAEREEAWRQFRRYVDRQGWTLGGLGAGEDWLAIYRATGMRDLYVGDEAVVAVDRFSLEGGRHKSLRQAVNRVAKYGYTISFHDPGDLDPALRSGLAMVMTKSRRGDVERGFSMTLGRVFEPEDRGLLMAVVRAPSDDGEPGPPVAFCQFVPAPGIAGYSLDLMRRDDGEHPNGLIDFAVVETIRELRSRGMKGLGLNFATMRAVLAGEAGDGLTARVQAWTLKRMGGSMQIESLWKFNAKFDPDWLARYAVYDSPEHLLDVAVAIARAESFWELPLVGRFLIPSAE